MSGDKERGLWELYENDPEKADAEIWGRKKNALSRRDFIQKSGLAAMTVALGAHIPFFSKMPSGLIPAAFAESLDDFVIPGKNGLRVLNDRPINGETPPHLLDDEVTPVDRHFVRNNGLVNPDAYDAATAKSWKLIVDGEVHKPLELTLDQLKRFKTHTYQLQVECGGNGRAGYHPPAKGNQWTLGAVACSKFTGARLKDVLGEAGLKDTAVYTGYYGNDLHLSGDPNKVVISRGTPIAKAMEDHTLIVWEMNGKPLPVLHGFPLRVLSPGWPGSASIKWLRRIFVRNREHDGPKMTGFAYRVPRYPVAPGTLVPEEDMKIIESMPVKSLITRPQKGRQIKAGESLTIRGHAWAGDRAVQEQHVSYDFGATWIKASLKEPVNRYAWQHWSADLKLPQKGYYEVWARATDGEGVMQPMVVPGWNPKGYLNNGMHRISVVVTG